VIYELSRKKPWNEDNIHSARPFFM